jgi:hypothetical protein
VTGHEERSLSEFKHRKPTACEGWNGLVVVGLTSLAFISFFLTFPSFWTDTKWFSGPFLFVAIAIGLYCAIADIRCNGVFECRLNKERLECSCPVKRSGDSFSVALDDIAIIERRGTSESSDYWWYITTKDGHRHQLTTNYDNPAHLFVELIRQARPDLTYIEPG